MGIVYRAYDLQLAREVAIKTLFPQSNQRSAARVWREARAAAALKHPGVVAVHECLQLPAGLCLVQELLEEAKTLSAELRSGLDLETRLDRVRDVAAALAHAHEEGVVHRDLKPENVLVDRAGRVRVSDFGLAWQDGAESLTATGASLGTPHYMAPEQLGLVPGGSRNPTVDVWALGVLLYEAVCLEPPFQGSTLVELMAAVTRPPRMRREEPAVSKAVESVCLRALSVQPEERYPHAGAFAAALEQARRGAAPRSRVSRRLSLSVLLLGAGLAVVAGAVWSHSTRKEQAAAAERRAAEVTASAEKLAVALKARGQRRLLGLAGVAAAESWEEEARALEQVRDSAPRAAVREAAAATLQRLSSAASLYEVGEALEAGDLDRAGQIAATADPQTQPYLRAALALRREPKLGLERARAWSRGLSRSERVDANLLEACALLALGREAEAERVLNRVDLDPRAASLRARLHVSRALQAGQRSDRIVFARELVAAQAADSNEARAAASRALEDLIASWSGKAVPLAALLEQVAEVLGEVALPRSAAKVYLATGEEVGTEAADDYRHYVRRMTRLDPNMQLARSAESYFMMRAAGLVQQGDVLGGLERAELLALGGSPLTVAFWSQLGPPERKILLEGGLDNFVKTRGDEWSARFLRGHFRADFVVNSALTGRKAGFRDAQRGSELSRLAQLDLRAVLETQEPLPTSVRAYAELQLRSLERLVGSDDEPLVRVAEGGHPNPHMVWRVLAAYYVLAGDHQRALPFARQCHDAYEVRRKETLEERLPVGGLPALDHEFLIRYTGPYYDCLLVLDQRDLLRSLLEEQLRKHPKVIVIHDYLLRCHMATKRWDDVLRVARGAVASNFKDPVGFSEGTQALIALGRIEEARQFIAEGVKRFPKKSRLRKLQNHEALR